jgi:hypothetical protein
VIESRCPGIAPGRTLLRLLPDVERSRPATDCAFPPTASWTAPNIGSALHAVYNSYSRCSADPFHDPSTPRMPRRILRPLFTTSWLIDDFLADNDFFGAAWRAARDS